ncbi:MAG: PspC domain-containing protein, partial [Streptosporangiaceae bacterium]
VSWGRFPIGPQHRARQSGVMNAPSPEEARQDLPGEQAPCGQRRLRRPVQDRMLAGVAASLAGYLDVDVTIVRIVMTVLTVAGGAGAALYVVGWLLIPEEGSEHSIADDFIGSLAR